MTKRNETRFLAGVLGLIFGFVLGVVFVWGIFWEPASRQYSTLETLLRLSMNAERKNQTLDEFLESIRDKNIEARGSVREGARSSNGADGSPTSPSLSESTSSAYIVVKKVVNVLGFGADWHIEMSLDSDRRIQRADVKTRPVGFP